MPSTEDGGRTASSGPDGGGGLGWLALVVGAVVLGWWLVRRGTSDENRVLPDDVPERLELGGTGHDGEDGVFIEPPASDGRVFPKVDTHGTTEQGGVVFPKLEVGPDTTETKGKGMVDATWKVEEAEKAAAAFPKFDSPPGEAQGEVFPKLEIDPGAAAEPAKGGNPETSWKVEEAEKAAAVFPKFDSPPGEAQGEVFPKLDAGTAAQGGEVIPKVEVDPGSQGDDGAGGVTFGDGMHGSRPGTDSPPDGDILDQLDDEG